MEKFIFFSQVIDEFLLSLFQFIQAAGFNSRFGIAIFNCFCEKSCGFLKIQFKFNRLYQNDKSNSDCEWLSSSTMSLNDLYSHKLIWCTWKIIQVNNYEMVVIFFHISHNLTWYSTIAHKFTRIYPVFSTYELTKQIICRYHQICVKNVQSISKRITWMWL